VSNGNNRSGKKQSRSGFEWRRLPRDLFRRWRLLWLSDKIEGASEIPTDAQMLSDTIFSDPISLDLLGDAEMDWNDDPFKPSFKFTPPTGSHSCGCGSSFQLD